MQAEIVPQPDEAERAAILAALDEAYGDSEPAAYRSAWWRDGLPAEADED